MMKANALAAFLTFYFHGPFLNETNPSDRLVDIGTEHMHVKVPADPSKLAKVNKLYATFVHPLRLYFAGRIVPQPAHSISTNKLEVVITEQTLNGMPFRFVLLPPNNAPALVMSKGSIPAFAVRVLADDDTSRPTMVMVKES